MTAEQKYRQQLIDLGTWQEAFVPEVHTLCMMERELRRAQSELKKARQLLEDQRDNLDAKVYARLLNAENAQYSLIMALRRDILAHRDALGLTPKGLQRLRGKDAPPAEGGAPGGVAAAESAFAALMEKVRGYE